jgi:hypothetical protein
VTWAGGFKTDPDAETPLAIPEDIARVCAYVAMDILKAPTNMGRTSRSSSSSSVSYIDRLPYWARETIDGWRLR